MERTTCLPSSSLARVSIVMVYKSRNRDKVLLRTANSKFRLYSSWLICEASGSVLLVVLLVWGCDESGALIGTV